MKSIQKEKGNKIYFLFFLWFKKRNYVKIIYCSNIFIRIQRRKRFTMEKEIYFDNSATTRPFEDVIDYISFINGNVYGNPSSLHTKGIEAEKEVRKARKRIALSMDADDKEIYFTSGGTESNNLAILGYLGANPRKGKHIITTGIEHPSVLEVYRHLEGAGYRVDYVGVDKNGIIDIEDLKNKITDDTSLISIILVNNEVGSIQPVDEVVRAKELLNKNAVIHVDAVQAYGKIKIYPKKTGVDMMSLSSHKIHGPKGVGAIYVNKFIRIKPVLYGGGQEALIRSGTENVSGIGGFGLASEIIFNGIEENFSKVSRIKSLFIEKLKEKIEDYKVISPENSSPYILNVSFGGVRAEVLLHHLEERSVFVSTGSACSSRKNLHSHVLKAMGYEPCDIEGAIRFSFSSFNNEEQAVKTVDILKEILLKIRRPMKMSKR